VLRVAVDLGGRARVVCSVARTASEQSRGLQGHPGLTDGTGMLFPFHPPRAATFHMGTVAFPIDVVFADAAGRVARIVHGAQPGSRARWSHPVVGAVVELPAGFASKVGLRIEDRMFVAGRRLGQQTYNLLRTLTEAELGRDEHEEVDGFEVQAPGPALMDGFYSKEPLRRPPDFGDHKDLINEEDRFQDRDPFADPNRMEQPNEYFEQNIGYSRPNDDSIGPLRPSAQRFELELSTFLPAMAEAAARGDLPYEALPLNEKRERAVVTPKVVGSWLHTLGLNEHDRDQVFDVATSDAGLDAIGSALIAAELAETANIAHYGAQPILVLTRNKRIAWT